MEQSVDKSASPSSESLQHDDPVPGDSPIKKADDQSQQSPDLHSNQPTVSSSPTNDTSKSKITKISVLKQGDASISNKEHDESSSSDSSFSSDDEDNDDHRFVSSSIPYEPLHNEHDEETDLTSQS